MNTSAHELRARLPDIGEALAAKMDTLFHDPTAPNCEQVLIALRSASQHVQRLHAEQVHGDQPTV